MYKGGENNLKEKKKDTGILSMTVGVKFGAEGSAFLSLSPLPGSPLNDLEIGSSRQDPGIGTLGFSFILKLRKQLMPKK